MSTITVTWTEYINGHDTPVSRAFPATAAGAAAAVACMLATDACNARTPTAWTCDDAQTAAAVYANLGTPAPGFTGPPTAP